MKGKKTGGRTKKNSSSRRINYVPTQRALDIYDSWPHKANLLDQAIIEFHERSLSETSNNPPL